MLQRMGADLCRTLLLHQQISVPSNFQGEQKTVDQIYNELVGELKANAELMKQGDGDDSEGSESCPSDDNLDEKTLKIPKDEMTQSGSKASSPKKAKRPKVQP